MTEPVYYDDLIVGERRYFGQRFVSAAEITTFARRYDPQFIHVDAEAARSGPFGGLIASGWHTAAMMMRMYADYQCRNWANFGSPGFEDLEWRHPVRPGDRLSVQTVIDNKRVSASRPDRGLVFVRIKVFNQRQQTVLTVLSKAMVARRPRNEGEGQWERS